MCLFWPGIEDTNRIKYIMYISCRKIGVSPHSKEKGDNFTDVKQKLRDRSPEKVADANLWRCLANFAGRKSNRNDNLTTTYLSKSGHQEDLYSPIICTWEFPKHIT